MRNRSGSDGKSRRVESDRVEKKEGGVEQNGGKEGFEIWEVRRIRKLSWKL